MTPYLFFCRAHRGLSRGLALLLLATILASPVSPVALGRTVGADSTAVTAPAGAAGGAAATGNGNRPAGKGGSPAPDPPGKVEISKPASSKPASRGEWVIEQIAARNSTMPPARRADKYAQMGDSLMSFFRATNYLFWSDYARSPLLRDFGGSKATRIWLHGDCHVENISAITTHTDDIVYGLDDFDDAVIGDYQLDLWRLATSLILLLRERGGFTGSDEVNILNALSGSYLSTLASVRDNNSELTRTFTANNTPSPLSDFLVETKRKAGRLRMLDKLTSKASGRRIFDFYHPDILPVEAPVAAAITAGLPDYVTGLPASLRSKPGYFTVKSVAQRLRGGMGSLGMARYYVLIEGPSASEDDDRVLDLKAQATPAPWPFVDLDVRNQILAATNGDQALRTVLAARALASQPDDHLGTLLLFGTRFSVRERTPARGTLDVNELSSPTRVQKMAEVWGAVLAIAHARADRDTSASLVPYNFENELLLRVGGNGENFRARVRQVALSYAQQVAADHAAFSRAMLKKTASRE